GAGGGEAVGGAPCDRGADVISDRDRRVLAEIERQLRAHDPELCEQLSTGAGGGSRLLRRTTSTPAIVGWVLALCGALLLGMSLTSVLLVVVIIIVVATIRLWRTSGDVGSIPWAPPPYGPPPFGPR
ncbi:MAG: DUF3040 domain-containing protein, partial [Pseudonocardia sp.]|nr:DUF3040 domain-containing protein [Pseudonocardia sp.]